MPILYDIMPIYSFIAKYISIFCQNFSKSRQKNRKVIFLNVLKVGLLFVSVNPELILKISIFCQNFSRQKNRKVNFLKSAKSWFVIRFSPF